MLLAAVVASSAGFFAGRAASTASAAVVLRAAADPDFPHVLHTRLFPTCTGCHAGIIGGDSGTMFPTRASCAACHDGRDVPTVAWTAHRARPSNLRFDHARHTRLTDSAGTHLDCMRCHGGGLPQQMLVTRAAPETCIGCHAHSAPTHLGEGSPCATCHVPLTRAVAFNDSAIAVLPQPLSHAASDFVTTHGALATPSSTTCAVCHSRESCARCHLNASTLPQTAALASDARVARLVRGLLPAYPLPSSHRARDFASTHGAQARANVQTCATCHAQATCRTCHTGTLGAPVISALERSARGAPMAAVRAHPVNFVSSHQPIAASGRLDCAGCHRQSYCTACHQGAGERRFHPADFVSRHASQAYAGDLNCASCHNNEVFCRSCHQNVSGIAAGSNRRSGAAHAGQPLWLLQHGQAARQGMTSCASCHQQTDCMQCHSSNGARINPHGPDFDADRMRKKNPTLCAYCHLTIPR